MVPVLLAILVGMLVLAAWAAWFVRDCRCRQHRSDQRRAVWEASHPEVATLRYRWKGS